MDILCHILITHFGEIDPDGERKVEFTFLDGPLTGIEHYNYFPTKDIDDEYIE